MILEAITLGVALFALLVWLAPPPPRRLLRACDVDQCPAPARVILDFDKGGWTRSIYVCERHLVPVIYKDGLEMLEQPSSRRELRPQTFTASQFPAADRAALLEAAHALEGP